MENPFKNLSKWQLYAVIAGGGLIGVYAEVQHHKKTGSWSPFKSAPASTAGGQGINPVTGLPYSSDSATDPQTGLTYLQEAEQYGSVAAAEAAVSAYGMSTATGSGIPVNPASPVSQGSINTPVGTSVYTSNSAWAQAVQAGLSSITGSQQYDGTDIGTALGAYLTAQPLGPKQAKVVSTAIAEYGPPPVGSYQIIPGGTDPDTGGGGGGAVVIDLPDGSGGWENVRFPTLDAYNQWLKWNQDFAANHGGRTQAYRSEWNTELTSLGVVRTDGQPLTPPSNKTGNPYDAQ